MEDNFIFIIKKNGKARLACDRLTMTDADEALRFKM